MKSTKVFVISRVVFDRMSIGKRYFIDGEMYRLLHKHEGNRPMITVYRTPDRRKNFDGCYQSTAAY